MSKQKQYCQGCSRHCPLDDLRCGRGRKLLRQMQAEQGQLSLLDLEDAPKRKEARSEDHRKRMVSPDAIAALDAPLERKITMMLRFLGRSMGKGAGRQARMRLLVLLRQTAGLRLTYEEASRRMGVDEGDVGRMVRRLERDRMVHRPEGEDIRAARLSKTGITAAARWLQAVSAHAFSGYEGLTPEERRQLYGLLQKLSQFTPWQAAGKE